MGFLSSVKNFIWSDKKDDSKKPSNINEVAKKKAIETNSIIQEKIKQFRSTITTKSIQDKIQKGSCPNPLLWLLTLLALPILPVLSALASAASAATGALITWLALDGYNGFDDDGWNLVFY